MGKTATAKVQSKKENRSVSAAYAPDERTDKIRMIEACKTGDTETVKVLLKQNPELVEFDNPVGRFAPLHYAARAGHAEIVKALLNAGANPNPFEHMLRNHCGTTTLELARLRGYTHVVALLEKAIDSKHKSNKKNEALRAALQARDMPAVLDLLRKKPALIHSSDDDGNTALHRAAEMRPVNLDYFEELLSLGADVHATNFLGFTPLHLTLFRNHEWTSRMDDWRGAGFLLARGADYNICIASAAGDIEKVEAMLSKNRKMANFQDSCLKRPLSCAAEFGHWDVVKLLLEYGADPRAKEAGPFNSFPLVVATDQNNLEIVKLPMLHGADPEANVDAGPSALYTAVERGYTDIADLLALHGASIHISSYAWKCDIPVLSAMLKANPSLANDLLAWTDESKPEKTAMVIRMAFKHGADPAKVGSWPLYRSADTPAVLQVYLEHGVNPNTADSEGKTTLHGMNRFRNTHESAGLLLDYGANINARDDIHQATPLAWAAMFGNMENVKVLLQRGAKPDLKDDQPWATPLFWAKQRGHQEIVRLLKKAGARK